MNIIGIDHGNSKLKTENFVFPNKVKLLSGRPDLGNYEYLEWNGNYYSIENTRATYTRYKTENDNNFILSLFGIAREIIARNLYNEGNPHFEVLLSVGLPPIDFKNEKDNMRDYFLDKGAIQTFTYNEENGSEPKYFSIEIKNVDVYPQGVAPLLLKRTNEDNSIDTDVIDIGSYTIDFVSVQDGKILFDSATSLENKGVNHYMTQTIEAVRQKVGLNINERHIEKWLINGQKQKLTDTAIEVIEKEREKYAAEVFDILEERQIDFALNKVIFIGGGSLLLKDLLLSKIIESYESKGFTDIDLDDITFIKEVTENAKGYARISTHMMKQRKAR